MPKIPSVSLYLRRASTRRYERIRVRNPQLCQPGDVYCLHIWHDRQRKWITVGSDHVEALRQKMLKENELLRLGHSPTDSSKGKREQAAITLESLRARFITYKRTATKKDGTPLDEETITAYEQQTQEFLSTCGVRLPGELTGQSLRDYMAALRKRGLTHRTVCNNYTSVVTFLKFCSIDHKALLPYSERPAPDDPPVEPYEVADLKVFFAALKDERHRLAFEALLKCGLREREMTTLEWPDLSLGATPTLSVQARKPHLNFRTKTGKGRVVPLEKNLALKLADWRVKNPQTKLIFGTKSDKEDTHFFRHATEAFERAGLPVASRPLHRFRDTFGTTVARSREVDLRTLQSWMGHASITQTEKYIFPQRGAAAQVGINATFGSLNFENERTTAVQ